jgi:hypothetical protein
MNLLTNVVVFSGPGSLGRITAEENMSKIGKKTDNSICEILNIIKKSDADEIGNYITYLYQPNLYIAQKNVFSSGLLCLWPASP